MKIIDGTLISKEISEKLKIDVEALKKEGIIPGLGIILVGHDEASEIYVRNKLKLCDELGIHHELYRFSSDVREEEVIDTVKKLNQDTNIDGIIIQSPLPDSLCENKIMSYVDYHKDVDGFGIYSLGHLLANDEEILAATPYGILKMLEHENIVVDGKNIVVVGASIIVGRPLAALLLNRGATVTIAHSKTKNLKEITKMADILIVAIGKEKFITKDYIKDGAILIDVGINRVDGKVVGDIDFASVLDKCEAITPVPGGVGPMTVTMLLYNVLEVAKKRRNK